MPHTIHLRLTPADLSGITIESIVSLVKSWSDKWVICQEHQESNLHYHVGVEDVKCSEKTIRNHINDTFQLPKGIRGQESKYYALKYDKYQEWDIAYIVKDGQIVESSGYSESFLEEAEIRGALKWPKKVQSRDVGAAATAVAIAAAPRQKESEFEKLLDAFEMRAARHEMTMEAIKRWIYSYYLNQRKPIPRSADAARYAYSIYAIEHDKTSESDIQGLNALALISGLNNI